MKTDKKFESKMTFYSLAALVVVLITVATIQKCNAQMNIYPEQIFYFSGKVH